MTWFLRFMHTRLGLLLWTAAMITCGSCASSSGHDQHAAALLKPSKTCSTAHQATCRRDRGALQWSSI
jgi:hypothetical protein